MSTAENPILWLVISLILLALCTYLPIKIKNDRLRNFVMRWLLVPASLFLLFYTYFGGIEVFRKLALTF